MKTVLNKLETLKKTSSKNEKIELLKTYLDGDLFRKVVQYALDELAHYNIGTMPKIRNPIVDDGDLCVPREEAFFDYLNKLKSKLGATNELKQDFADLCAEEEWWEVAQRIVKKDLKCGVHARTVNTACPRLISIIPYQRCSGMNKLSNIQYPAYLQRKADATFGYFVNTDAAPYWLSRKGREFKWPSNDFTKSVLYDIGTHQGLTEYVLCGELQVMDENGGILNRKTANGILNKALKGTMKKEEVDKIIFDVWDCIPVEYFWNTDEVCPLTYEERRNHLIANIKSNFGAISFIEEVIVESEEDARTKAKAFVARGEEGGILKNKSALWKNNTSTHMIKFKVEEDCDLIITDVLYGDPRSKYENCIGRLYCESADGKIKVSVGSGLSDTERGVIQRNDDGSFDMLSKKDMKKLMESYKSKIASIRFNDITSDKKTKQETLYLPRILEIREDKTEADTYEYIHNLI